MSQWRKSGMRSSMTVHTEAALQKIRPVWFRNTHSICKIKWHKLELKRSDCSHCHEKKLSLSHIQANVYIDQIWATSACSVNAAQQSGLAVSSSLCFLCEVCLSAAHHTVRQQQREKHFIHGGAGLFGETSPGRARPKQGRKPQAVAWRLNGHTPSRLWHRTSDTVINKRRLLPAAI